MPIQSKLGHITSESENYLTTSQWINLPLKIWKSEVKKLKLQKEVNILRWPAYDPEFLPAIQDASFRHWALCGLTAVCTMYKKSNLMPFDALCELYSLDKHDYFRYLQLRNYVTKRIQNTTIEEFSSFVNIFISAYKSAVLKVLSVSYTAVWLHLKQIPQLT